jgi:DNA polymerase-3 subunit alpha
VEKNKKNQLIARPKSFINLHSHDGMSTFDGLGLPKQHFDFVIENTKDELEIPAMAITNHGNMNSYAHAQLYVNELNKAGKRFKFLPGVEAYFHPDLAEWKKLRESGVDVDDSTQHSSAVENEDETKFVKRFNPLSRRHHLIVLAKNSVALEHLFELVSLSAIEGFYKYPRIDHAMLKRFKGDFVISTACIGGTFAFEIFTEFSNVEFDKLYPSLVDDDATRARVLHKLENVLDRLVDAVGQENLFLELQFNKLPMQHLVNRMLIELSKKSGVQLIATADSHYYRPDVWREREIYKRLGWLNYESYSPDSLPKSVDELKCELYPKNASQMWETYLATGPGAGYEFYDDELVQQAIERTHDIAFNMIADVRPDTKMKLPSWCVPAEKTADQALRDMCVEKMQKLGLAGDKKYEERLEHELAVIKDKQFSQYFLMMQLVMDIANSNMLCGAGRGSAAGSLVNYLLGITQIDPLKFDLIFERFINRQREGAPDIDSDVADRDLLIKLLKEKFGDLNVIPISNYNGFQIKSLVKDISRFFHKEGEDDGLDFQTVNAMLVKLDDEVRSKVLKQGDDKNLFELRFDDCMQYSQKFREFMDAHPEVSNPIKTLLHENKTLGKHAGGVIVSERVPERMPVIRVRNEFQTAFVEGMHYKHLEEIGGWIKVDILGLETLRVIHRCIELILARNAGKKLELDFGSCIISCFENDIIKLADGSFKKASELSQDDDVFEPIVVKSGYVKSVES